MDGLLDEWMDGSTDIQTDRGRVEAVIVAKRDQLHIKVCEFV